MPESRSAVCAAPSGQAVSRCGKPALTSGRSLATCSERNVRDGRAPILCAPVSRMRQTPPRVMCPALSMPFTCICVLGLEVSSPLAVVPTSCRRRGRRGEHVPSDNRAIGHDRGQARPHRTALTTSAVTLAMARALMKARKAIDVRGPPAEGHASGAPTREVLAVPPGHAVAALPDKRQRPLDGQVPRSAGERSPPTIAVWPAARGITGPDPRIYCCPGLGPCRDGLYRAGESWAFPASVIRLVHSQRGTRKTAWRLVPSLGEEVSPSSWIQRSCDSVAASQTGTHTVPVFSPAAAMKWCSVPSAATYVAVPAGRGPGRRCQRARKLRTADPDQTGPVPSSARGTGNRLDLRSS
jgi:hypothetical protein